MSDTKVSPSRAKKQQIVAELTDKIKTSKGLVFANYQGLTHVQLEKLKKALKAANAELVVTKNTLLKLSLEKVSKEKKVSKVSNGTPSDTFDTSKPFDTLSNPTATLFLYADPIEPLKQLAKTIKELNLPTIKFGILDGKALSEVEVLKLSTLPPRNVLLAQIVFGLKFPIYGLPRTLAWNIQKFVMTMKAIENKKQVS